MDVKIAYATTSEARDLCFAIRNKVFVVEQNVPVDIEYDEFDSTESKTVHYLVEDTHTGEAIATARVRVVDTFAKVERVAVHKIARGQNIGLQLMEFILADARDWDDVVGAKLGAQNYAIPFYEKLGFTVHGDEFDDAGIPHHNMQLEF